MSKYVLTSFKTLQMVKFAYNYGECYTFDVIISFFIMANLPAAKKSIRQTHKRSEQNKSLRRKVKDLLRKTREIIKKGDKLLAQEYFKKTTRTLDKAAKNRIIHPNKAKRHKARLASQINSLKGKKRSSARSPKKKS